MSTHKRRSIIIECDTYHWLATNGSVHVWHPKLGHKSWLRDYSYKPWTCAGYDPITPRIVAEFIYREYLHREPPPRPVRRLQLTTEKLLVPTVNRDQPEVYLLMQVRHWFDEDGWAKTRENTVAAFVDPQMAKVQAKRLNPPYADLVREMGQSFSWKEFHNRLSEQVSDINDLIDNGFTLWTAVAKPLYQSELVQRTALP